MAIADDWTPFLRKLPFFAGFRDEDMRLLAEKMRMLSLPKGAVLCRAGEETDTFTVLLSGRARMVEPGREEHAAAFLNRGDALGEMGILTGESRSHTVIVEATAELLILDKADFEAVMAANPHLAVPISRLLSMRLVEARRKPGAGGATARFYALVGPASLEDRVVLAVNLAIALVEQTRRRVLLLDILDPGESGAYARALGLEPVKVNEHSLRQEDLQNPDLLARLCTVHASGLELLSLPRPLMEGKFAGMIYPCLAALRRSHDFVLASVAGVSSPSNAAVLDEADKVLSAAKDSPLSGDGPAVEAAAAAVETERRWTVRLEESPPEVIGANVFRIPWRATFTATRTPFLPPDAVASQRAMDRLARRMGGVSLGFAMGSGAALGYVLIGFLKVLERNGIVPDILAGTSMGALIGSFYASGKSPDELQEIALSITKAKLWNLADFSLPRQGIIQGNQVLNFLKSVLGEKTFAELLIPLTCVATDIMTGEEIHLNHGRVAEAVRGSLSLPFFFKPFFHQGRYLVDGGLVNPVPTSAIAAMGADIIVGVNTTGKPAEKRLPGFRQQKRPRRPGFWKGPNILQVLLKMIYTMQFGIAQFKKGPAHILLEPDISAFTWADFHRAQDVIKVGEDYIEPMIPKIKSFLPFFADTCRVPLRRR